MKSHKIYRTLLLLLVSVLSLSSAYSQESKDEKKQKKADEIQNLIQSKKYVFVAQSVSPMSGRLINLNSAYDLRVSGDTVTSQLPYFGRAYTATLNPSEGGINFTSTDFKYSITKGKKGVWEIAITPQDARNANQLYLTISDNGYASLRVNSNNRQSISYNGYITGKNNG